MKKILIIWFAFLLFYFKSSAQLTKGNWLVGGNARIETQQQNLNESDITSWTIQVTPNIGYFFSDKFAGGLKTNMGYTVNKINGVKSERTLFGIGPFSRFYFLPIENRINVFAQGAYEYQTNLNGFHTDKINISAGPVIYFNSSVGLECTLNYEQYINKSGASYAKTFFFGIGFQIHLENEKNN